MIPYLDFGVIGHRIPSSWMLNGRSYNLSKIQLGQSFFFIGDQISQWFWRTNG